MTTMARRRSWMLAVAVAGSMAGESLVAQQTRSDEIAQQQAQKATDLRPYTQGRVEETIENLRRRMLEEPSGFYPVFGSVYSGGGFTLGAGYRRLFAENAQWYVRGLYSFKNYKLIETGTASLGHLDGRLTLSVAGGWRDATQVAFFGLGMDTSQDQRANTRLSQAYANGAATLRPVPYVVLEGAASLEGFNQQDPQGDFPAVGAIYTPESAPGVDADVTYFHSTGLAGIDTRPAAGYARSGGFYGLFWHNYLDVDDVYSFDRVDVDLVQHVPVMRETWVLSLHGRVQTTVGEGVVPFFLLPSLGSGSTLRAYQSWRFRDRHSLLTSAEWRWIPNKLGFDMALFFDAGKVTARRADLDLSDLKTDWGVGARFHGPRVTVLRLDLARGSEGWNLVFAASAPF
jgi:hypothetical protein